MFLLQINERHLTWLDFTSLLLKLLTFYNNILARLLIFHAEYEAEEDRLHRRDGVGRALYCKRSCLLDAWNGLTKEEGNRVLHSGEESFLIMSKLRLLFFFIGLWNYSNLIVTSGNILLKCIVIGSLFITFKNIHKRV